MKSIALTFKDVMGAIPWPSLQSYSPDLIIAIERGGLILGALIAVRLNLDFVTIKATFYNDSKPAKQIHDQPKISGNIFPSLNGKKVLIVDDVSNTGKTMETIKQHVISLGANEVKTFVYAGNADFSCREFEQCLIFPWQEAE
jgi:hypoxanthine phosphoribosyltransferase